MKIFSKILVCALLVCLMASAFAADGDKKKATTTTSSTARPATAVRADWNRDGWIDYRDPWVVRDDWRWTNDWNRDGIIDWRDDWAWRGGRVDGWDDWAWRDGFRGDWVRGDWNRDGVVDWRDGWRALDGTWATGAWDPYWNGAGWRPEGVVVRDAPVAETWGWDDWAWRDGWRGDWNRDGIVDWRDGWRGDAWRGDWGWNDWAVRDGWRGDWAWEGARAAPGGVRVREVPAGSATTTTTTKKAAGSR